MMNEEKDPPLCEDCGRRGSVTFGPCPYAAEINGDDTPLYLCEDCRDERATDI